MYIYLVLVHVILQFSLSQLVESDDDQCNEDVDEEKWENHEENDVKNGHFDSEPRLWAFALVRRGHGVLQNPGKSFVHSPIYQHPCKKR